jgi:hypothetical protein
LWIGKDLEGSCRDIIDEMYKHLIRASEENQEKQSQVVGIFDRAPTWKSEALRATLTFSVLADFLQNGGMKTENNIF